ncbi:MAG: response regulator [Candidatus Omnitrophica bacterium]|nr:response regulator [Candidatus Omnitrophota bacterium]
MTGLNIATKIAALVAVLILSMTVLIGSVSVEITAREGIDQTIDNEFKTKLTADKVNYLQDILSKLQQDILVEKSRDIIDLHLLSYLARSATEITSPVFPVDGYPEARSRPWNADWKTTLENFWASYLSEKKGYRRISLYNFSESREIVSVYRETGGVDSKIQARLKEDYRDLELATFLPKDVEVDRLLEDPNRVYFSGVVLDRGKNGELITVGSKDERRYVPVMHAAVTVEYPTVDQLRKKFDWSEYPRRLRMEYPREEKAFGLLVITMSFQEILDRLSTVEERGIDSALNPYDEESRPKPSDSIDTIPEGRRIYVTNQDGYFLAHPLKKLLFGMEPEIRAEQAEEGIEKVRIQDFYPELRTYYDWDQWKEKQPAHSDEIIEGTSYIRHQKGSNDEGFCVRIRLGPEGSRKAFGLAMVADYDHLKKEAKEEVGWIQFLTFFLGILGAVIAFRYSWWLLKPLKEFSESTRKIAAGDYQGIALPVARSDEVGALARDFGQMSENLQKREQQLRDHQKNLEKMVEAKTKELRETNEQLERANRAKDVFLANMSHELRTPMNAIIGYSEMLEEEAIDEGQEDFVPDLKKIQTAGRHLLGLINDILDISKIEAGKMEIYLEDFEPKPLIEEVLGTIQPLIEKNQNHLEVSISDQLGTMRGDVKKIRQTLFNLLSNASKFTEKGTIRFEARKREGDYYAEFVVSDTGIGMTPEQMAKLFQPFAQAEAKIGSKYEGTGLGLAICKKFCEMMGGTIEVESEAGEGSTFRVVLPIHGVITDSETTRTPGRRAKTESKNIDGRKILVIDDDPAVTDLMSRYLEREGYNVRVAYTGKEGLELAREERPDVITLDVLMPEMDGWTVLDALKKDPSLSEVPVIMLTFLDDQQKGFSLGASDFLRKPVRRETVVYLLQKHLQSGAEGPVLIVDDEPDIRDILTRVLEEEGYRTAVATNGKEAIDQISQEKPALVLLDILMPEMDGFEVVERIQKHPEWKSIPVIIMTALDLTEADRQRLNGYVEKILEKETFNPDHLLAEISNRIGHAESERSEKGEEASGQNPAS